MRTLATKPSEVLEYEKPANQCERLYSLIINHQGPIWRNISAFYSILCPRSRIPQFPVFNEGKHDTKVIHYVRIVEKEMTRGLQVIYDRNSHLHFYCSRRDFRFSYVYQYPEVLVRVNDVKLRDAYQNHTEYP